MHICKVNVSRPHALQGRKQYPPPSTCMLSDGVRLTPTPHLGSVTWQTPTTSLQPVVISVLVLDLGMQHCRERQQPFLLCACSRHPRSRCCDASHQQRLWMMSSIVAGSVVRELHMQGRLHMASLTGCSYGRGYHHLALRGRSTAGHMLASIP